jgi:CDP-4-dehydro-6-deoxyglucose reductase, E1
MISSYKWPLMRESIGDDDRESLAEFLKRGSQLTNGPVVQEFERAWSTWLGVKHSVFLNSGASGNYVSIAILRELGGRKGEVIIPALGWVSDVSSVVNLGFKPIFVDVDMNTFSINEQSVLNAINKDTVGIVLVHGLGFVGNYDRLIDHCTNAGIFLIEDCCEAHGARYASGRKVGTIGNCSIFSFYYGHHMTTVEGGMICTDDDEIYNLAKMFRSHGMVRDCDAFTRQKFQNSHPTLNPLFTFAVPGFNFRSTEINAVLGLSQLPRLDQNIKIRSDNLIYWLKGLDNNIFFKNYKVAGSSNFALPLVLRDGDSARFNSIKVVLDRLGVEYRVGTAGGGNLARQPFLKNFSVEIHGNLEVVDHLHSFGLYVGNFHEDLRLEIDGLLRELENV